MPLVKENAKNLDKIPLVAGTQRSWKRDTAGNEVLQVVRKSPLHHRRRFLKEENETVKKLFNFIERHSGTGVMPKNTAKSRLIKTYECPIKVPRNSS